MRIIFQFLKSTPLEILARVVLMHCPLENCTLDFFCWVWVLRTKKIINKHGNEINSSDRTSVIYATFDQQSIFNTKWNFKCTHLHNLSMWLKCLQKQTLLESTKFTKSLMSRCKCVCKSEIVSHLSPSDANRWCKIEDVVKFVESVHLLSDSFFVRRIHADASKMEWKMLTCTTFIGMGCNRSGLLTPLYECDWIRRYAKTVQKKGRSERTDRSVSFV